MMMYCWARPAAHPPRLVWKEHFSILLFCMTADEYKRKNNHTHETRRCFCQLLFYIISSTEVLFDYIRKKDVVLRPLSHTTLIDSSSYTHNPKSLLFNHSHSCNKSHSLSLYAAPIGEDDGKDDGEEEDDGETDGIIISQSLSTPLSGALTPVFSALHITRVEAL